MRSIALHLVCVVVVLAGCTAGPGGAPPSERTASPTTTAPTATATDTPTPTATPTPPETATDTPAGISSIPGPVDCLTDAVPQPAAVDGVEPRPYPEPPTTVTEDSLVGWAQSFEIAYFHNDMLAGEDPEDDYNLTEVSAYAEVRAVNLTPSRYGVRFSNSGATTYASGLHGDLWMDVGYIINDSHVVRVPLDYREQPIRATNGTVVLVCP